MRHVAVPSAMAATLFKEWCETKKIDVTNRHKLHIFSEKEGARSLVETQIDDTVASHYDEPTRLADRIARLGYAKAAKILRAMLPQTLRARSGQLGEILATEAVPAVLKSFEIPIKRLRWSDGREMALRGEDLLGISIKDKPVRFLKGESKSRVSLTPSVVAEARAALTANNGRPSEHAMGFVMKVLFDRGDDELALTFEEYMLVKSIAAEQLVHLTFVLSGNDASNALTRDLKGCNETIEQHAVALRIADHKDFVAAVFDRVNKYGAKR